MGDFDLVFATLRDIAISAATGQRVSVDEPGNLVIRTIAIDPKTGEAGWFAMVAVKKSYVSYHLMPLYADPALADGLSPALSKRRQGKTCFNFKGIDDALFAELADLTRRANAA